LIKTGNAVADSCSVGWYVISTYC